MENQADWKILRIVLVVLGCMALGIGAWGGWSMAKQYFDTKENARVLSR